MPEAGGKGKSRLRISDCGMGISGVSHAEARRTASGVLFVALCLCVSLFPGSWIPACACLA